MNDTLVPPVSARSAVLSLLLGAVPPSLTGREIVAAMGLFDIAEPTTRVALSRMVANGDLMRRDGVYTLSDRLAQRQSDTDMPEFQPWTGTWEMGVVTTPRRDAADRVALRAEMKRQRVAELREGVWTRPANLRRRWPDSLRDVCTCFETRPVDDPVELAERLWDLDSWARRGHRYLDVLAEVDNEPARFRTMVAAVHHLNSDPLLPIELLPADWPATDLAKRYAAYRSWLAEMSAHLADT